MAVNPEAVRALSQSTEQGPVVMLNLLKFRADGGREGYERYAETATRLVAERGGRILYVGEAAELLEGGEDWDVVALAEYPSRATFLTGQYSHNNGVVTDQQYGQLDNTNTLAVWSLATGTTVRSRAFAPDASGPTRSDTRLPAVPSRYE